MASDTLILDAPVLIGFHEADWFDAIAFWRPEYSIVVPERLWDEEFTPTREIEMSPEWLSVRTVESTMEAQQPGQLSDCDWRCLFLSEDTNGVLVTSDRVLKRTAEDLGVRTLWKGRFLLDTFEACGIEQDAYRNGLQAFLDDAHLPKDSEEELRDAEKPS